MRGPVRVHGSGGTALGGRRVECGRLGSRQRRKVRRSVRHALDEEENRQNETRRDGRLERLLTRFERLEADMGFSGGRLTGWDAAAPGSTGGEIPSGFVRGESTRLRVIVVSHVFPGLCCTGSYLSGFPKKVSARWR